MSVSYESAMATLTAMFASVDREVIAMILQANGGHMENSVEHLLALSGGGGSNAPPSQSQQRQPQQQQQQPQVPRQVSQPQRAAPAARPFPAHLMPVQQQQQQPPQYPGAIPYAHPPQPMQPQPMAGYGYAPASVPYGSGHMQPQPYPPQPMMMHQQQPIAQSPPQQRQQQPQQQGLYQLPDDFLRPPSYFQALVGPPPAQQVAAGSGALSPSSAAASAAAAAGGADVQSQIEQDHLLAQMLMDEQFMQDLARHPERYQGAPAPAPQLVLHHPGIVQPSASGSAQQMPQQPQRMAPPARPHPDFVAQAHERSASSAALDPPTPSSARKSSSAAAPVVLSPSNALGPGASSASLGSEPLHPHLRALEASNDASGSGSGPSREQQTSFASKWASLTAAAREKLARLSERFKKDQHQLHDEDEAGGGVDYRPMGDNEPMMMMPRSSAGGMGARGSLNHSDAGTGRLDDGFLSREEAARLQAGYNVPAPKKAHESGGKAHSSNPKGSHGLMLDDESDPFGAGANGSDAESDDLPLAVSQLGGPTSSMSGGKGAQPASALQRQASSGSSRQLGAGADYDDDEDDEGGSIGSYQPPRLGGAGDGSSSNPASPSNVHAGGRGFFSSHEEQPASATAAARASAAASTRRKKSTAEAAGSNKEKAMPLLQDL